MKTTVSPGDVALTFDDGPDPTWTERALRALGACEAPATFFVQGPAVGAHPELIGEITAAGHEVGLHCFEHKRHSTMSTAEIRADVDAGLAALASVEVTPTAWRTPWGDCSAETAGIADEFGLELWGWSRDSHDWRGDGAAQMLDAVCRDGLEDGPVVLMHDGLGPGALRAGCDETVRLTDLLLTLIGETGLRPTTLSALAGSRR